MVKPITVTQYSGFLSFALLMNIVIPKIPFKKWQLDLLIILGFLLIMAALFETLWSFSYWFSTYELKVMGGAPEHSQTLDDLTYTPSPTKLSLKREMGLNSSAKKNVMFLMMSIYLVYELRKLQCNLEQKPF